MNIEYKCPMCGAEVNVITVLTYPVTTCYRCTKCAYHKDEQPEIKTQTIIAPL